MKLFHTLLLTVVACALAEDKWDCPDFSKNREYCIVVSDEWPTYSNGEPYKLGESVCLGESDIQESFEYVKQGIPVVKTWKRRPCRIITSIDTINYINFDCCDDKFGSKEYRMRCYRDTTWIHCKPIKKFQAILSMTVRYSGAAPGSIRWRLKNDPDYVLAGDTIEVFRGDGSLRYRGYISIDRMADGPDEVPVKTSGFCYDGKGRQARRVNNADLCK